MLLPRVKQEQRSERRMRLEFPVKVFCADRPSEALLPVLHELMPYGTFVPSARVAAPQRGPVEGCSMQRFLDEGFEVVNADYPNTYLDLYITWDRLRVFNPAAVPADASAYIHRMRGSEMCAWEGSRFPHYRHALFFALPVFGDRVWNMHTPLNDERETTLALTRSVLGCDAPAHVDLFSYLKGVPLGDAKEMAGDIFASGADREALRRTLGSLHYVSADERRLTDNLLSLL